LCCYFFNRYSKNSRGKYNYTSNDIILDLSKGDAAQITTEGTLIVKNIENIQGGTGNDTLTGNSLENTIKGGAGADILRGGAGADTISGGTGVDKIYGDDGDDNKQTAQIKWATIYYTYAQSIIAAETTSFISKYSIAELSSNLEQINANLRNHLTTVIAQRTPFNARYVGISQIQYPEIITKAQEGAAQRREQIQTEEAQLEISKVKLERELQEARLTRQIEIEKSQTTAAANRVQSETITSAVLEKQRLDNQAAWIEKWNGILPGNVTADVFAGFNKAPK